MKKWNETKECLPPIGETVHAICRGYGEIDLVLEKKIYDTMDIWPRMFTLKKNYEFYFRDLQDSMHFDPQVVLCWARIEPKINFKIN